MALFEWVFDILEFGKELLVLIVVVTAWNIFTGKTRLRDVLGIFIPRFRNQGHYRSGNSNQFYGDHSTGFGNRFTQTSDEPLYSNDYEEEEKREYDSPGDYLLNGRMDEFDPYDLNHVVAADEMNSYKN